MTQHSEFQNFQVKNYHITRILSQQLVVPSMSTKYNVTLIHDVLEKAVGAVPTIGCEFDKVILLFKFSKMFGSNVKFL